MANNENLIPIPGRLHSVATEGHVAGADEIFDDTLNKDQATINQEVNEAIGTGGSVDSRIAAAVNALDSSKSQSAGADGLALNIVEENGKITSISGSIASGTYDAAGSASAVQLAAATDATTKVNAAKAEIIGNATSACDTLGKAETKINTNATAISSLSSGKADKATTLAGYGITDAYTKSETYTKTEVNGLVDTPHQEYVTVDAYSNLPATGSKDTIYRVSNYNGSTSQVDASVYSEYAWNGSQYVFLCVKSQIGEVFDISVYNNNAKYADLAAALNGGANIPQSLQKGGMSIKFVQSSDNKYIQYRLMTNKWSINPTNWCEEVIDTKYQTVESDLEIGDDKFNTILRLRGGHIETKNFNSLSIASISVVDTQNSDFELGDENGNIILKLKDGNIETKNFNSAGKKYDIIMFMGQSNMAGRGISNVTWPATAPELLTNAGFEYRAISDDDKLNIIEEPFGYSENTVNGINDGTKKTGSMVTAFVNSYYRNCHIPVIAVSASDGGTSIAQWQPNSPKLLDAQNRLDKCVTFLKNINYKIGHKYMVWCQGETDGDLGTSKEDYLSGFNSMFSAMQTAGIEKCFVIRIGECNSPSYDYSTIINAQNELCYNNKDVIMVNAEFASFKALGLMKDEFHYYQEGYNRVGTHAGAKVAYYRLTNSAPIIFDTKNNELYFSKYSL